MNLYQDFELFNKCLAIWKSCTQITHLQVAVRYTYLAVNQLMSEQNIKEEEREEFKTKFILHLLSNDLPLISENELKMMV